MEALAGQEFFQVFAARGIELSDHFTFLHINKDPTGTWDFRADQKSGQSFGTLPREARQTVLGQEARHSFTGFGRIFDTIRKTKNYTGSREKQMPSVRHEHPYLLHDAILQQPAVMEQALLANRQKISRAVDAAAGRSRFIFVGVGTSYHGALTAERWMRRQSAGRAEARAEEAFELVHSPLALGRGDVVVVLTHTGGTRDSLEVLRIARAAGALSLAVTGEVGGQVGTSGFPETDFHFVTGEREETFAYTKSYTSAMAVVALLVIGFCERGGWAAASAAADASILTAAGVARMPALLGKALETEAEIRAAARAMATRTRFAFLGAGLAWFTAMEAALKVKETSYLPAQGYQTEEILHGPFSELDEGAAVIAFLTGESSDDRVRDVLRAATEIGAFRLAVTFPRGNRDLTCDQVIEVPDGPSWMSPFLHLIPAQLLAYHLALARGINPDTGRQDQEAHARATRVFKAVSQR
ncbi:MAG: SIS domain-containing protein [Candidatus Acidiferrales bacterium]